MTLTATRKQLLHDIYNQKPAKPIEPLWDVPRRRYDEESYLEYGFYQGMEEMTDAEINEFFNESVAICIPGWMDWDCTGRPFTVWLHWKRNPNGDVSFIHRVGYDI